MTAQVIEDAPPKEDDEEIIEEEWTNENGVNVFSLMDNEMELNEFILGSSGIGLKYKSFTENMTPLNMTYGEKNESNDDSNDLSPQDEEFYDGTGNLVWLAALMFGLLLEEPSLKLQEKYLNASIFDDEHKSNNDSSSLSSMKENGFLITELGCGAGVAGIATLLLSMTNRQERNDQHTTYYVSFTDNDAESLELCNENCTLNGIHESQFGCHLLSWGQPTKSNGDNTNDDAAAAAYAVPSNSQHVILATDVLYDMVMIAPLLETAVTLLRPNGYLLLSHVPRFCLPKDYQLETEQDSMNQTDLDTSSTQAYHLLEQHIIQETKKVGLILIEAIRPHEVLHKTSMRTSNEKPCCIETDSSFYLPQTQAEANALAERKHEKFPDSPLSPPLSIERIREMHAVFFVLQKVVE